VEVERIAKEVVMFLESQYGRNTFDFKFNTSYNSISDKELHLNICAKNGKVLKVITSDFLKYIFNIRPMLYIAERKMWLWQKELIDEIEGS